MPGAPALSGLAAWAAGACVIAAATFVQGLSGFGVGLVALAFLPLLMEPASAVALVTLYAAILAVAIFVPVRREVSLRHVGVLVVGAVLGTPPGVWVLATAPAGLLRRLIGVVLLAVVALEASRLYPRRLPGRGWAVLAGVFAGLFGGAVGAPGPPVILYAAAQGWGPRAFKANLQAFFVVNQAVLLLGFWWTGLLTPEVGRLAAAFAIPGILGVASGMLLFDRVDQGRFRRIVFSLLFVMGLTLLVRG